MCFLFSRPVPTQILAVHLNGPTLLPIWAGSRMGPCKPSPNDTGGAETDSAAEAQSPSRHFIFFLSLKPSTKNQNLNPTPAISLDSIFFYFLSSPPPFPSLASRGDGGRDPRGEIARPPPPPPRLRRRSPLLHHRFLRGGCGGGGAGRGCGCGGVRRLGRCRGWRGGAAGAAAEAVGPAEVWRLRGGVRGSRRRRVLQLRYDPAVSRRDLARGGRVFCFGRFLV